MKKADFVRVKSSVKAEFEVEYLDRFWEVSITYEGNYPDKPCYYAWLRAENYGIKEMMFGCSLDDNTLNKFIDLVIANFEDYADGYYQEYILEDDLLRYIDR